MSNQSESKKSIVRSGISLSVLTLLSRVLGLVREMTKAAFLGTSSLADAFQIAFSLPNLFRRLFAENSVSVAFIPTFRSYLEKGNDEETQDFINATFTLVSFLTAIVCALGIALAPVIVPLFAGEETDPAILPEMALLTRIMFPYLFVVSLAALFQGILNGVKVFAPSGFTPVLFNLIIIGFTYILSPYMANPARAMSVGVITGGCVQAVFQLPFVIKNGFRPGFTSLRKTFANKGTQKVLRLIGPTIIGMAAYQLNDAVSTALAGRAGTGIASSIQYSLRLQELILGIFAVSIGTVILPELTTHAQKKDFDKFNELLKNAIRIVALICIPTTFFSLITGENIIRLVYQSKSFSEESVRLTKDAFLFHIAGLFFIALNRIISPAFYAQSNTKTPTFAGIIGFGTNILLALILVGPMQGGGIALALTIASFANTVVLFVAMKKENTADVGKLIKSTLTYSLKMIVFSVVACVPVLLMKEPVLQFFAGRTRIVSQGFPLIIFALVFFAAGVALLAVTKDPVFVSLAGAVKRKFRK